MSYSLSHNLQGTREGDWEAQSLECSHDCPAVLLPDWPGAPGPIFAAPGNHRQLWDFPGGPVVNPHTSTTRDTGGILSWETKIPHALWHSQENF